MNFNVLRLYDAISSKILTPTEHPFAYAEQYWPRLHTISNADSEISFLSRQTNRSPLEPAKTRAHPKALPGCLRRLA